MADGFTPLILVQEADFDPAALGEKLTVGRTDVGALVTFTGLVRDLPGTGGLSSMTLEHYPGMTERELARIAEEAAERWPLQGIVMVHRYGRLTPGERIVMVATASPHREAAFQSASFLMDYLKTKAPFWKKEASDKGETWVEAKASDDSAATRWSKP